MTSLRFLLGLVFLACLADYAEGAIKVMQKPFATAYTPNSMLGHHPKDEIRYAGTKIRYSTCTGVAWFDHDRYLAAINLSTSSVQIYEFNENDRKLTPLKRYNNQNGLKLKRPENLVFSHDNCLLAIPNTGSGNINLYQIKPQSLIQKSPGNPFFVIEDYQAHGARFSPSGEYFAYVTVGDYGGIYLYQISKSDGEIPTLTFLQKMPNAFYPLKPKSIDFSGDGRFAVIGYSQQISRKKGQANAVLASYAIDAETGMIIPEPISVIDNLLSIETVQFYGDSSCVFAADQITDRITGHGFDSSTGKLTDTWIALQNPEAKLSFPHGLHFSSDGRFLAVSNYGGDKITVYEVE